MLTIISVIVLVAQLFLDMTVPPALYAGHWQSCQQADGEWGEAAVDYPIGSKQIQWSFHMGPFDEFALFRPGQEPTPDNHFTSANLLRQPHALKYAGRNAGRQWSIDDLNLWISVVQGGGSRDDCLGWYILIRRLR